MTNRWTFQIYSDPGPNSLLARTHNLFCVVQGLKDATEAAARAAAREKLSAGQQAAAGQQWQGAIELLTEGLAVVSPNAFRFRLWRKVVSMRPKPVQSSTSALGAQIF